MSCESKRRYDDIEIIWHDTIPDSASPYSLKQNNDEYPVPVWAKILSVVGVVLLGYFMIISLMS